jgi:hypothetical protein
MADFWIGLAIGIWTPAVAWLTYRILDRLFPDPTPLVEVPEPKKQPRPRSRLKSTTGTCPSCGGETIRLPALVACLDCDSPSVEIPAVDEWEVPTIDEIERR